MLPRNCFRVLYIDEYDLNFCVAAPLLAFYPDSELLAALQALASNYPKWKRSIFYYLFRFLYSFEYESKIEQEKLKFLKHFLDFIDDLTKIFFGNDKKI